MKKLTIELNEYLELLKFKKETIERIKINSGETILIYGYLFSQDIYVHTNDEAVKELTNEYNELDKRYIELCKVKNHWAYKLFIK